MKTVDVVKIANVTARQLDWWAEHGITRPHYDKNGHREYSEKDVLVISLISELRKRSVPLWKARQAAVDWRRRAGVGDLLLVTGDGRGRLFRTNVDVLNYLKKSRVGGLVVNIGKLRAARTQGAEKSRRYSPPRNY